MANLYEPNCQFEPNKYINNFGVPRTIHFESFVWTRQIKFQCILLCTKSHVTFTVVILLPGEIFYLKSSKTYFSPCRLEIQTEKYLFSGKNNSFLQVEM